MSQASVPGIWTDDNVRCAVIELLKEMSQSTMACLSPLAQSTISNISNRKYCNRISSDTCKEFGNWYRSYKLGPSVAAGSVRVVRVVRDTRLTFHPRHELPLMRQWYNNNSTPSEKKLKFYSEELNRSHVRQSKTQVTVKRLQNWWKNERQKEIRIRNESATRSRLSKRKQLNKSFSQLG